MNHFFYKERLPKRILINDELIIILRGGHIMYYHVLLMTEETGEIFEIDIIHLNDVLENVVRPYMLNKEFQLDGYFIEPSKVKRLKVTKTEKESDYYVKNEYDKLDPGIIIIISPQDLVFDEKSTYVENITRELLERAKKEIANDIEQTDNSTNGVEKHKHLGKTVFLAYSFRENDDELVGGFKTLLIDKGFQVLDGKADRLGLFPKRYLIR